MNSRKRSTIYRTLTTPTVVPVGAMELIYGSPGTYWKFHTPVGYSMADDLSDDPRYYYYVQDHLGNVCAVWSSESNSFEQQTFYYPSGVPMSKSSGQVLQPNKFGGKPYEEMHGFDCYEYEFRNYYATIMRFTAMDPLCEQTPWQSPYVYAANNPVCNIDWMGLSPWGLSNWMYGTCNLTILNEQGNVVYHKDDWDLGVYVYDGDDFDESKIQNYKLLKIGYELPFVSYKKDAPCLYLHMFMEGGNAHADPSCYFVIYYGNRPATIGEIRKWISENPSSSLISILEYVAGFSSDYLPKPYSKIVNGVGYILSLFSIGNDINNIYKGEKVFDSSENIFVESLSIASTYLGNPILLCAAFSIDMYYNGGKNFAETVSDINTNWNDEEYVKDWFGRNYMMY